jgi:hypothetical protein
VALGRIRDVYDGDPSSDGDEVRTADGVRHLPSGSEAVIVGVAAPQRVTDDFYRAEAFWFYDGLSSVGWKYTVSFDNGSWRVDTEKMLWIS